MNQLVEVLMFSEVLNSMSSADGRFVMIEARGSDGVARWLAFPYEVIPQIIEVAAVQFRTGSELRGEQNVAAFDTKRCELGATPDNEVVLTLTIGQNGNISFLLPGSIPSELREMLQIALVQAKGAEEKH